MGRENKEDMSEKNGTYAKMSVLKKKSDQGL